jgi:serine/threonine protein kinase
MPQLLQVTLISSKIEKTIVLSDMWGVGVIAYLLVSGGVSPFWGGNRYRTMAKTLSCDYTMDLPNFEHISENGKDFITKLLVLDPKVKFIEKVKFIMICFTTQKRQTADECLVHPWLTDNRVKFESAFLSDNITFPGIC